MRSYSSWLRGAFLAAVMAGMIGAVAPAQAVSVSNDNGSARTTHSSDKGVTVTDTKRDGYNAYTEFYVNGSNSLHRIETTGGKNSSTRSGAFNKGIEGFNACTNIPIFPDNCSGMKWV